ncbi:MAG: SPOR domain-containing protein [candidate division KSB1 bacterium]|nr:SPOR domain-containing protein [candidate division KSB1 bacterium]MDZ7312123.1 SPOR domain-containing protein [candidate division KSB1 bacterium]
MISFRWLILRLFWSLLLLPAVAFPLLWLLHEVVFPNVYFQDDIIVLVLWIFLLIITSLILSRIGARRFTCLDNAGQEALEQNREKLGEEVFAQMRSLFASGLLSHGFQQKIKRRLLRQYFAYHAMHPEDPWHREQLLAALREGIHANESYEILKTHVLQQPALTLPVIDLAEELLERQPDDNDLLVFLTRQYLTERRTHYRAEHFYAQHLAKGGPLVPEILSLCLDRLVRLQRRDDFAVWCYVRAFQQGEDKNPAVRKLLHETQQKFQSMGRHDALANMVTTIVADFTPKEIAGWTVEQRAAPKKTLRFRVARIFFYLQQQLVELYSRLREHRKWVYLVAGSAIVLGIGYIALSGGHAKVQKEITPVAAEDSTTVFFALQVGALRNANTALREAEQLRSRGLEVHVLKPQSSRGWHRIRVGKYRSRQAAQVAADSLKAAGIVRDYFITEYEKQ